MEPKQARRNYYFAMYQVRRFIPGAKVSGVLLVITTGALISTYGLSPLVKASHAIRGLIALLWFWNLAVFTVCGAMVVAAWLMDRHGDTPKENGHPSVR
jgi:hypothetical protein